MSLMHLPVEIQIPYTMSINKGNTLIKQIYYQDTPIRQIFAGNKIVYPNAIEQFIQYCLPLGGNPQLISAAYEEIEPDIRQKANILLFPSVFEAGVVYGMNTSTGGLVPFAFSRKSEATYFDRNVSMKTANIDTPRIDYRNYSEKAKILMEKETTNLVSNIVNQSDILVSYLTQKAFEYSEWTQIKKNSGSGVFSARTSFFAYNFGVGRDYVTSILATKGDSDIISLATYQNGFTTEASKTIRFGAGTFEDISPSLFKVNGLTEDAPTMVEIRGKTNINQIEMIAYPGDYTVNNAYSNKYALAQIERDKTYATSYIPKLQTRQEDQLSIQLAQSCKVYIKTIFEEKYIEKEAGYWNIQNDIEGSDGIQCIAIFA